MKYRITGLEPDQFQEFFGMSDEDLAKRGIVRSVVHEKPGVPCRISLQDAEVGERVLLLNYEHQRAASPYRSSHAIFIREKPVQRFDAMDVIPEALRIRTLSVRAFDGSGMMVDADIVGGAELEPAIERLFEDSQAAYLHLHNAKRGCYVARVDRVDQ
jgi:hypothetical protein